MFHSFNVVALLLNDFDTSIKKNLYVFNFLSMCVIIMNTEHLILIVYSFSSDLSPICVPSPNSEQLHVIFMLVYC